MQKKILTLVLILLITVFTGCTKNEKQLNLSMITTSDDNEKTVGTTLHEAVRVNDLNLVKTFIQKKADLNKKDKYGYTPLHLAAKFNHYKIAKELISHNALVNTKDNFLDSPLIDSTKKGYTNMSKLLVCNGADVNTADKKGVTAFEYALKVNDVTIAKLLKSNNLEAVCSGKKVRKKEFYDLITMDNYDVIESNTPKICGNILDLDVRQVQITFDRGKTVIEAQLQKNRWCAQTKNKLANGTYTVWAMAINSLGQRGKAEDSLIIKSIEK
jgi:hypothetical protein